MWPFRRARRVPPRPTPAMHEEARLNPGGWVYVVDGTFGPNDVVPADRIVGAWKVDRKGKLTGRFKSTRDYRPTRYCSPIERATVSRCSAASPKSRLAAWMRLWSRGRGCSSQ
jgi:hypothetical protein